jgi:hypothetical protein
MVDAATAEAVLRADPAQLPAELARRINDTRPLTDEEIADARQRLIAVQAYLQGLKNDGQLITDWNKATYDRTMEHPEWSYLGQQAQQLATAHRGGGVVEEPLLGAGHDSSSGSFQTGEPGGATYTRFSSIGLTSRLISGCTSRIELATTNGGASLLLAVARAFSGLFISGP